MTITRRDEACCYDDVKKLALRLAIVRGTRLSIRVTLFEIQSLHAENLLYPLAWTNIDLPLESFDVRINQVRRM